MGNYTSKIFSYNDDKSEDSSKIQNNLKDDKINTNQMCTPVNQSIKVMIDPRSASSGIARTPIEVSTTPGVPRYVAKALPKHLHTKKYLETDFDNIESTSPVTKSIPDPRSPNIDHQRTPIIVKPVTNYVSPVVVVKEGSNELTPDGKTIDPRSPATTFDRTPILKQQTFEHLSSDNNDTSIDLKNNSSSNIVMSYCETTNQMNISEIQALPEIIIKKPVNLVDRLNVSDIVDKSHINNNSLESICSDDSITEEQVTVIPNLKSKKYNHQDDSMINDTIDKGTILENQSVENIIKETTNKDNKITEEIVGKIRVWRDSISPQPTEANTPIESIKNSQDIIIEFDDNSIISSSKIDNTKWSIKAEDNINNQIIKTQKVKTLKKDDFKDEAPKCRTPLGNRSNNTKSIELGKSPHQFLRNKALSNKQQENTPPNAKRFRSKNTTNGTTWDPDMSIII